MGHKYQHWISLASDSPQTPRELQALLLGNRHYAPLETLHYGDHGLVSVKDSLLRAIRGNKRIALYADYDVDGTMSCVSWIWLFQSIGFSNYTHYIPCRFREGYGLNLQAVQRLIEEEGAELILTMDTGITANEEAAYCKGRGVEFVCTDHHSIQASKMPDCLILNPKQHPDEKYQELCGCGITFVLLRQLAKELSVPPAIWTDLLALAGMATICDVVPLNPVNHKLARMGVDALMRSQRPVIRQLREACAMAKGVDEQDVGFRLGPRINAVGRLEHADAVIRAFIQEDPSELIHYMSECNDRRKSIQENIVKEARSRALEQADSPVLFLGGDWHPGVVGIAASKLVEEFWKPTWLFQRKEGICKGSARSLEGFDITDAMGAAKEEFDRFGGHRAAGGYTFQKEKEEVIRQKVQQYAMKLQKKEPSIWESRLSYDCTLPHHLLNLSLSQILQPLKPFGNAFPEPLFRIQARVDRVQFYCDKKTGEPKHTAVHIQVGRGEKQKVMFFYAVYPELEQAQEASFVVSASKNTFLGRVSLSLIGKDFSI